jgi:ABC-type nitrate/sulfonate/bicarbonate transport system substrate-binding protein
LPAILLLFLTACGKQVEEPKVESLRIGFLADPLAALLYVAQEEGLFQRHSLEVAFRDYEGGAYALKDLRRGEIEVAVATEFAVMMQSLAGNDLRAIGTLATANNSEVIARTDRGIHRPEDLKGRRLGVSKGMNTEFLLGAFLAFNGLRLQDVQIVDLRPSGLVRALAEGEVDAVCLYPPFSYSAKEALNGRVLSWSAQGGQEYFFLLTTTEQLLRSRPRAIKALLAALLEAEEYMTRNHSAARDILARKFQLSSGQLAERLAQLRFQVGLHQDLLTMMEDEAHWAVANGLAESSRVPNLFQLLSLEMLESLKPEAVGVIH